MPKFTKKQLQAIANKYYEFANSNINLTDYLEENFYRKYISFGSEENNNNLYEAIGLIAATYTKENISEDKIELMLCNLKVPMDQFYSIQEKIDEIDYIDSIDENGKVKTDMNYLHDQILSNNADEMEEEDLNNLKILLNDNLNRDDALEYDVVKNIAAEEHRKKINNKIKNFDDNFISNPRNNVLFDKKFFDSLFKMELPKAGENPLYKDVKDYMERANTLEDSHKVETQKKIAMNRINGYVALKNSFDAKGISDFFKSPIHFIKEWWTLRGIKSEIQEKYHFSDNAIENVANIVNTKTLPQIFAMLDENGETITTMPTAQEISDVNQRVNKGKNTKIAQQNLEKLKLEFNYESANAKGKSKGIESKIMLSNPSKDDFNI